MNSENTLSLSNSNHVSRIGSQNQWWKKLAIVIFYFVLFSTSLKTCNANKSEESNCTFPQHWEGSWFLSGDQQPISIKGNTFSSRGTCVASDGDKFLIVNENGCHKCLIIHEKHRNVLQFTESYCEASGTLEKVCEQIARAAEIYSLFRENAEPVKCPLRGLFTLTYNKGHGECKNPVSNVESSAEDSKLLLNLQACPDVAGTENKVEELTCLANWRDGHSHYLVGLISQNHTVSNEDRYRCFVYEKVSAKDEISTDVVYKLSQSGDATCNGIDIETGFRLMTLRQSPPI